MFGLIKKLHEKDAIIKAHSEEISRLREEISRLQDRLVIFNNCNLLAKNQEQKLLISMFQLTMQNF